MERVKLDKTNTAHTNLHAVDRHKKKKKNHNNKSRWLDHFNSHNHFFFVYSNLDASTELLAASSPLRV
jgi:hypothetical protein